MRRFFVTLTALMTLFAVGAVLANDANAWSTTYSSTYKWCGTWAKLQGGYIPSNPQPQADEQCFQDTTSRINWINNNGYHVISEAYQDANWDPTKGSLMFYVAFPNKCDTYPNKTFDNFQLPNGWTNNISSVNNRDSASCWYVYLNTGTHFDGLWSRDCGSGSSDLAGCPNFGVDLNDHARSFQASENINNAP